MKSLLRVGLRFGFFVYAGLLTASPTGDLRFEKRLNEAGLAYSPPAGFVDDGPNSALEKELNDTLDSSSPFVVHRIRSTDGKVVAYVDIRVLGMDIKDPRLAVVYPMMFESNAAEYCELVSNSPCSVSSTLQASVVQADYRADFGVVLKADHPDQSRIGGHKKARVIAISKPSKGLFYITVAYDSDSEFERSYKALRHMLTFR